MKSAQLWLDDLTNGTTSPAFPNILRTDMVNGLRDRLVKPHKIDQANSSLCGPASLMYCLATSKADLYAEYVVELYHTGKSKIGRLSVAPGSACKRYKPNTSSGIHPVDWVALASLRDSENDFFNYDSPSDEAGGITMPGDLVDWFKDVGFSKDANFTNFVFTKGIGNLSAAGNRYNQNHSVCLFINGNMLSEPKNGSWTPDHWVVLASPVIIKKGRALLTVYSWGGLHKIDLKNDDLCENLYGYISSSAT